MPVDSNRAVYAGLVTFLAMTAAVAVAPLDDWLLQVLIGAFALSSILAVVGMAIVLSGQTPQ